MREKALSLSRGRAGKCQSEKEKPKQLKEDALPYNCSLLRSTRSHWLNLLQRQSLNCVPYRRYEGLARVSYAPWAGIDFFITSHPPRPEGQTFWVGKIVSFSGSVPIGGKRSLLRIPGQWLLGCISKGANLRVRSMTNCGCFSNTGFQTPSLSHQVAGHMQSRANALPHTHTHTNHPVRIHAKNLHNAIFETTT